MINILLRRSAWREAGCLLHRGSQPVALLKMKDGWMKLQNSSSGCLSPYQEHIRTGARSYALLSLPIVYVSSRCPNIHPERDSITPLLLRCLQTQAMPTLCAYNNNSKHTPLLVTHMLQRATASVTTVVACSILSYRTTKHD